MYEFMYVCVLCVYYQYLLFSSSSSLLFIFITNFVFTYLLIFCYCKFRGTFFSHSSSTLFRRLSRLTNPDSHD